MHKKLIKCLAITLILCSSVQSASATPIVHNKKFANCAALNKVYPGGVSKASNVKNKGGATKKSPTVNAKIYLENAARDRDRDGIACEK